MTKRYLLVFHDGRLGRHDLFGDPVRPGVYAVPEDRHSLAVAQQTCEADLAVLREELAPAEPAEPPAARGSGADAPDTDD